MVATALSLAAGCGGSSRQPPCDQSAGCDEAEAGAGITVRTETTVSGFRSTVTAPDASRHTFDWTASSGETSLAYRAPGGGPPADITIPVPLAEAVRASTTSLYLFANLPRIGERAATVAGCSAIRDLAGSLDCAIGGTCCDSHAACVTQSCGARGDSADAPSCLFGDKSTTCSPACRRCHETVVACLLHGPTSPSRCCDTGNCGFAQQCMISDSVVTDPCTCADFRSAEYPSGIPSRDACPAPARDVQIRTYGRAIMRAGSSIEHAAAIASLGSAPGASGACPEDPTRPCIVDIAAADVRGTAGDPLSPLVLVFDDGGSAPWHYLESVRDSAGACSLQRDLVADAKYARDFDRYFQVPFACRLAAGQRDIVTVRYEHAVITECDDENRTILALGLAPYPRRPTAVNAGFTCAFFE